MLMFRAGSSALIKTSGYSLSLSVVYYWVPIRTIDFSMFLKPISRFNLMSSNTFMIRLSYCSHTYYKPTESITMWYRSYTSSMVPSFSSCVCFSSAVLKWMFPMFTTHILSKGSSSNKSRGFSILEEWKGTSKTGEATLTEILCFYW